MLIRFLLVFLLLAVPAWAQSPTPAASKAPSLASLIIEPTPTEIPGSDAFIYRDAKPDPLRLFVFKPKGWKATDKRPALVFYFGGGWSHGTPLHSAGWARSLAKQGFVGIAPDYRTSQRFDKATPLESVADGRAALHWVEEHAAELGIDPARIVAGGSSAGGHLALWDAIEKAPPGSDPAESPKIKPAALILVSAPADVSGDTHHHFGEHAADLSPGLHLDPKMPPVLMFHGDADPLVPYQTAVALHDKLVATGNVCEFVSVPGGKHGVPEIKATIPATVQAFLTKLKLLPVAP